MKKRWIAALMTLMLVLQPCLTLAESTPLLFRVTDAEGHRIYLLGTIHVGREDMYPLSGAVEQAFEEADVLAVEVDLQSVMGNLLQMLRYSALLVYGLGDDITNHISEETYRLGIEKLGYPEIVLKRMKPIAWYSLAEEYAYSLAGLSSDWGVDMQLLSKAKKANKTIEETESMEAQMETLLALPDDVMDEQIRLILSSPEESAEGIRLLANMWQTGNRESLEALLALEEEAGESSDAQYDEYNETLIYSRNDGFEQQAKDYLQNGVTALIAIGTFHIVGEDGLAARLARAGYLVEEIGKE